MNTNTAIAIAVALVVVGGAAYFYFGQTAPDMPADSPSAGEPDTTQQMPITSGENPRPGDGLHGMPAEAAAVQARKDLAAELSVDEGSITIMQVQETTWNDGCLGLGGPAESCLQALVDGFRVELLAQGKTYVYRTDQTGGSVRMETQ